MTGKQQSCTCGFICFNCFVSPEEFDMIIAVADLKLCCILKLAYRRGLTMQEIRRLRRADVNGSAINVPAGKYTEGRTLALSDKLAKLLDEYMRQTPNNVWLFEGETPGGPCDERSLQIAVQKARERAKITKNITLQKLRHSFAMNFLHLPDNTLADLKESMGLKDSRSVNKYAGIVRRKRGGIIYPE